MKDDELVAQAKRINDYFESQGGMRLHNTRRASTMRQPKLGYLTKENLTRITKSSIDDIDMLVEELALSGVIKIEADFASNQSELVIYPGSRLKEFAAKTISKPSSLIFYESFDVDRCVLYFAGKEILLSKKVGKENNPVRLLNTLIKDPERKWFEDQIIADWEGTQWEQIKKRFPKKRIYHAAHTLNNIVARDTGIKDFLIYTTKECKINPNYLKRT